MPKIVPAVTKRENHYICEEVVILEEIEVDICKKVQAKYRNDFRAVKEAEDPCKKVKTNHNKDIWAALYFIRKKLTLPIAFQLQCLLNQNDKQIIPS